MEEKKRVEGLLIAEKLSEILARHKIPIQDSESLLIGDEILNLFYEELSKAREEGYGEGVKDGMKGKVFSKVKIKEEAHIPKELIEKIREEGRREVYEAIVFDKNIPHDITTFVAANLWKNMRDKAREELSKLTIK